MNLRPTDADAADALSRLPEALKTQQIILKRARVAALLQKAKISQQAQNYKEALPMMRELVALDPDNPVGYNELLSILEKSGQFDEGLDCFAQQMTGGAQAGSQQLELAGNISAPPERYTQRGGVVSTHALASDPRQPRLRLTVGRMYLTLREFDNAIPYLQSALALNPDMPEGYPLLAKALYWNGQFRDLGRTCRRRRVTRFPQSSEYKFYEAQALFFSNQQALARSKMRGPLGITITTPAPLIF